MLSPYMVQALTSMSYACYLKLNDLPSLNMMSAMSVHSASEHDLCCTGLTNCEVT